MHGKTRGALPLYRPDFCDGIDSRSSLRLRGIPIPDPRNPHSRPFSAFSVTEGSPTRAPCSVVSGRQKAAHWAPLQPCPLEASALGRWVRSAASTQLLRTFRRSSWASYGRSLRCCTATLVGSSEICAPPPWCQLLPWSPRQRGPASRGMHGASACLGMEPIRCPLLRQKCTASLWRPKTLKSPKTLKRPTSGGASKRAQLAGALHRWCSGVQMRWLRAREGAESWLMPRDGHLFE